METLEQQLVYKDNESPSIFLVDEYETIEDKDYIIFDNMLHGMNELNIKNIVVTQMKHSKFKEASAYLMRKQKVNIVWHITYKEMLCILEESSSYQFEDDVVVIIKIDSDLAEVNCVFENVGCFKEKYNNIAGVMVSVDAKSYDNFIDFMELFYKQLNCTLIVSPQLDKTKPHYISWPQLDILYCNTIEFNKRVENSKAILMEYGILPARLLNEHPCNGYVCAKHTCHSKKNDLPRRLMLLRDGSILPESDSINCSLLIGNIRGRSLAEIVKEYNNKENHFLFKKLAKDIYIKWVQTCPFRVVPWRMLFIEEANKENCYEIIL